MKKILLLVSAVAVAGLAGVAAFLYTGKTPESLVEDGKKLERKVKDIEQRGRAGLEQAQDAVNSVKSLPIPSAAKPNMPSIPAMPTIPQLPTPAVQPQPSTKTPVKPTPPPQPPAPPLEDVHEKDQDKLKDILNH